MSKKIYLYFLYRQIVYHQLINSHTGLITSSLHKRNKSNVVPENNESNKQFRLTRKVGEKVVETVLLEFLENGARFEEKKDTSEGMPRKILYGNTQNPTSNEEMVKNKDSQDAIDLQQNASLSKIQTPLKTNLSPLNTSQLQSTGFK